MDGFRDYDTWKLDNGEKDGEVYQADLPEFFHEDEGLLAQFELEVENLAASYGIRTKVD